MQCKVIYYRYQIPFYLWLIKPVLKHADNLNIMTRILFSFPGSLVLQYFPEL